MKTTLLILACFGLLAPAPSGLGQGANPSPREEATNNFNLTGINANTFLDIYANLAGRTVLHATSLQSPPITLKTVKPLTHADLVEAMKTVLELNGIAVTNQGSNSVQAVMTK